MNKYPLPHLFQSCVHILCVYIKHKERSLILTSYMQYGLTREPDAPLFHAFRPHTFQVQVCADNMRGSEYKLLMYDVLSYTCRAQ
jgi:hypothetical protein